MYFVAKPQLLLRAVNVKYFIYFGNGHRLNMWATVFCLVALYGDVIMILSKLKQRLD